MQIEYSPADVETFWSRVDKNGPVPAHRPDLGPCWIWTRAKAVSGGYGIFGPALKRVYRAHRFSWTITHGPIPPRLWVCHACDNPPCVRPSHLFVGTNQENMRDCADKGRTYVPTEQRGAAHHSAKLTDDQVREIRHRHTNGERQADLAREYRLSDNSVSRLLHRLSWKHVADHPEQQPQE